MRLAPKPLAIEEGDGFKGTDLFGYEKFGEQLAGFVESLEGPSVIALDGPWGSGKTVFARQWAGLLRKQGSAVIYFDAFAADSGEDPLFDIASQLFAGARDKTDEETRQAFVGKTVRVIKSLAPVGVGVALESATAGLIGQGVVQAFASALSESGRPSKSADEQVSAPVQRHIERALERKEAISDFRKALASLAVAMKKATPMKAAEKCDDASRPLVVIIDELDRCKPAYALNLLKKIKYVFDVQDICFVVVTDVAQLENILESRCGMQDASVYLKKIFQMRFILPETRIHAAGSNNVGKLIKELLVSAHPGLLHNVNVVLSPFKISLREVERVVIHVGWCLRCGLFQGALQEGGEVSDNKRVLVPVVVCVVCALDADMYSRLRKGGLSFEELIEFVQLEHWSIPECNMKECAEILSRAFPPKEVVENGPEAIEKWKREEGGLSDRVVEVCQSLDVVGDPRPGRRR